MSSRSSADPGPPVDGGPALFRLVRFWSRRWINRTSEDLPDQLRRALHVQVVEAVAAIHENSGEATITSVAHQLGIDHSGASRMVREATDDNYLARAASEHDRRRIALRLTDRGERLLSEARAWQREVFIELTAGWDKKDRERFAGYLQRIGDELQR